jgi:predicted metal-dependent HD superfamily phosphohydrolase
MGLRPSWDSLIQDLRASQEADRVVAEIVQHYSAADRHYHNLDHLADVLGTVDRLSDEAHNPVAVRLAAWFHDVIYDSRAKDNEERSADYAASALQGLGAASGLIAEVSRLILLTKSHRADAGDADARVLIDADLAILGATEEGYERYAAAIRREYAWVPEPAYRAGRRDVLERFLRQPRIFQTARLFGSLEARARDNLARELASLA